jgi:hypothetical protein
VKRERRKNPNAILFPAFYSAKNVLPQHVGNPLLEALPRFKASREMLAALGSFPPYVADDRQKAAFLRMLSVLELSGFFIPMRKHFAVVEQMGLVIYEGYTHRNPATADYKKAQIEFYRQSIEGAIVPINLPKPSTAPSFSIFGVPGMGKSSIVERILNFYPQAIIHAEHHFMQLVWLKVDCPLDGSLKQLLLSIVGQIDETLDTSHGDVLTRRTEVDKLVVQVAKVAAQHHLGVLVIDEIQNLLDAPGVGPAKMLNFFVTLSNEVKVPFVIVGTPKAQRMLEVMFREARRVSDKGAIQWDRMSNGEEWKYFIGKLWPYQWTANETKLTDELSNAMYLETQGITALAVRLYQLVQLTAIRGGKKEMITKDLISRVASDNFGLLKKALEALRSGNPSKMKLFEDLFEKCMEAIDEKLRGAMHRESGPAGQSDTKSSLKDNLIELGASEKRAEAAAEEFNATGPDLSFEKEVSEWVANESEAVNLIALFRRARESGSDIIPELDGAGLILRAS